MMKTETLTISGRVCRVLRSGSRGTVCVRIARDGVPEIIVPTFLPDMELWRIADKYTDWIDEHVKGYENLLETRKNFALKIGGTVRCLGGKREIRTNLGKTVSYDDEAFYVPEGTSGEFLRRAVTQAYRMVAKDYLPARTYEIARTMGLNPTAVRVNSAKTRWGSCSSKGSINFSWYAVMADKEDVDYIIIHELCHMKHMNHSPEFWAEVRKWCPEVEERKEELKEVWREIQGEKWD